MKQSHRTLTIILLSLLILILVIFSYYFYIKIPESIKTDSWVYKFPDKYEKHEVIKCNLFDFINPEFAFVGIMTVYDTRSYEVDFYQPDDNNPFNTKVVYTGGTTIENTTFPELVEMVKEDCDQFKKAYYDKSELGYTDDMTDTEKTERWHATELKNINWSYSKAPSQEEGNEDIAESFRRNMINNYSVEGRDTFTEIYGDPFLMSNEEVVALKERIDEEGEDERIYIADRIGAFKRGYPKLTDKQKQIILDKYGEWEHLTDKELADYSARIGEDSATGELVLD